MPGFGALLEVLLRLERRFGHELRVGSLARRRAGRTARIPRSATAIGRYRVFATVEIALAHALVQGARLRRRFGGSPPPRTLPTSFARSGPRTLTLGR